MTRPRSTNAIGYHIETLTAAGWVGVSVIVDTREETDPMLRVARRDTKHEYRVNEALKGQVA